MLNGLQGPQLLAGVPITFIGRHRRGGCGFGCRRGPGQAKFHPLRQRGNFLLGQLCLGRHLNVALVANCRNQFALIRLAGNDDGAFIAAPHHAGAGVQPGSTQTLVRLLLVGAFLGMCVSASARDAGGKRPIATVLTPVDAQGRPNGDWVYVSESLYRELQRRNGTDAGEVGD